MKTVKLKIEKGISCFYAGIFVYAFFRLLCRKDEQQPNSVSQDEQRYIGDSIAVAQTQYWQSARLSIKEIYTPSVAYRMGQHGGRKPFRRCLTRTRA